MIISMLREAYGYTGVEFTANYILSNLVRSFNKDDFDVESYSMVYGEDSEPFFNILKENKNVIKEISNISGLLFEKYGIDNIHEHFLHIDDRRLEVICEAEGIVSKAVGFFNQAKEGVGGFLKTLWKNFKGLGVVKAVTPFLEQGFAWAKDMVTKGLAFFGANIGSLVVPAMLIFRTAPAAIAGINAIRKRRKMKALSGQEKEKFGELAKEKQQQITTARKKVS